MKVRFKDKMLIVSAESAGEQEEIAARAASRDGHIFRFMAAGEKGFALEDLGPREEALGEPINIGSTMADERLRVISNLAPAPFELDGRLYASVEGFWQGLKTEDPAERSRVAGLSGMIAKTAGRAFSQGMEFSYEGKAYRVGRPEHWHLMYRACFAKFTQNQEAMQALLLTGNRPLEHRMKRDSETIPGVIMADIWMRVRRRIWEGGAVSR